MELNCVCGQRAKSPSRSRRDVPTIETLLARRKAKNGVETAAND